MWEEYKKRFVVTQIFVAIGLFVAWRFMHVPGPQLVLIFVAMQLGGVMGSVMGARIKRDVAADTDDDLPLNRR